MKKSVLAFSLFLLGSSLLAWQGEGDRVWNQISKKLVPPGISAFTDGLSKWESESDAVYKDAVSNLPRDAELQVAARFKEYKEQVRQDFQIMLLAAQRRAMLLESASSAAEENLQPFLNDMSSVLETLKSKPPESEEWFSAAASIIQQGKNSVSEKASAYFSELGETIENTRVAFAEESKSLKESLEAVFEQFNTVLGLKDKAIQNRKSLLEEKARLELYLKTFPSGSERFSQLKEKLASYSTESDFWADTVRQCIIREKELRQSLEALKMDIGSSLQSPDRQDMVQCQDYIEKVQAALYLSKVFESVQASCSDYHLQASLAGRNADAYLSSLFSGEKEEAVNFVQKMNNSLLRDFSLAYYWRSINNSGFKDIDVAIYSDQNFQKLKSYGYAFSHPEKYVNSKAKSAYDAISADPEEKRLYTYFENAVNSGTAHFDISFIGKDISDVAHDYLWDVSVKKEKNYKKNHKIYNFFTRKSSKMKKMRKAMADIDGSAERKEIMETVANICSELAAKQFYEEAEKLALGESVIYTFDTFLLKCRESAGVSYSGDTILKDYFESLDIKDREGFTSVLKNISELLTSGFSFDALSEDSLSCILDLLGTLDDYESSANRLLIMNLTGKALMDMHSSCSSAYVEKLCRQLSQEYSMLEGAMTDWDAALNQLVKRTRKNWEKAALDLRKNKDNLEQKKNQIAYGFGLIEDAEHHQVYHTALKMASEVDDFENQVLRNIEMTNKKVDKKITDFLEGKGYVRSGSIFKRRIIIDETLLGGIESENQKIEGYRWFIAPMFNPEVDLSSSAIRGLDLEELKNRIEKAKGAVDCYSKIVFGQNDGWSAEGLFPMHIGYVPVMSSSNPGKVSKKGSGEYGRIFELFYKNEARLRRGLAAIDVPFYMQKIWDEDGNNDGKSDVMLFSLPSIRQGGQIVCSIFSSINPALGMMVNAFDSTTFAALDMIFAGKSFEEAANDVHTQMGRAAASWGTSSISSYAQPAQDASTGARLIQSTAVSVGKEYADQLVYNNTAEPDPGQGLGTLVRNWISSRLSGFLGDDRVAAERIANFAGNVADAGYDLVSTGKTKLNILNLSSFCDAHAGLLEMNIGGDGPVFEIGPGGYDFSRGRVENVINSAYILKEDNRIRHSSSFAKDNKIAMRALFSEGKIQNQVERLYNLLLQDEDLVKYGFVPDSQAVSFSDSQGLQNIVLNLIPSRTLPDQLKMAVILAHEAYRNGKDDGILQILETSDAVLGHARMAYDILSSGFKNPDIEMLQEEVEAFRQGNIAGLIMNAIYSYSSGADYWRIIGDGKVIWDGHMNLYQEDGSLLYTYQQLRDALLSGVTSVAGVQQDRLSDIAQKNNILKALGTKSDGTYTSKSAEALLSDGYMSCDEASELVSGIPDIFQHYSARTVANNNEMLKKYFSSQDMLKRYMNRSQPVQYLNGVRATLLPDSKSVFHIAPEDKATYKWVFDDGRELVIGEKKDGTAYVQTDDHYLGTYNMATPDNPLEHALKDVLPYLFLGNTPDDSSIANFIFSM